MTASEAVYDVIVIGAGVAGLTAARRGQQLGAKVALLEKGAEGTANNSRHSGGRFHAAYLDPKSHTPDQLYDAVMHKTEDHARKDVARAFAENVRRALEFLASEGAEFARTGEDELLWNELQPRPVPRPEDRYSRAARWKGRGPDRLLRGMAEAFTRAGGVFRRARACDLAMEGGAVAGVYVEDADARRELIRGRAVVMADGGFQANRDLVNKYVTRHTYRLTCSDLDTGDCLLMALAVGAKAVEMNAIYASIVLRDSVTHERLSEPPIGPPSTPPPTMLINAGIVVNGSGERIGDEGRGTEGATAEHAGRLAELVTYELVGPMAWTEAPGDCWVVFDDAVWETAGRIGPRAGFDAKGPQDGINPVLIEEGGTLLRAASIAELARGAGLPVDRLQQTVDAFNRFCRDGTPLAPHRSGKPMPIAQPPFFAIPIVPAILFAMGGLLVNGNGQVLDQREKPISGLYAAGGTMGGLQGGPHLGYAGGWSEASTFGLLSAEHAVTGVRAPQLATQTTDHPAEPARGSK